MYSWLIMYFMICTRACFAVVSLKICYLDDKAAPLAKIATMHFTLSCTENMKGCLYKQNPYYQH